VVRDLSLTLSPCFLPHASDTPELAHFHQKVNNSRSRRSAPVRQTYMQAMDARRAAAHFSAPAQAWSAVRRPLSAGDVFRMTRSARLRIFAMPVE
jgi:hypothetical protein